MPDILHELTIGAPPDKIYQALVQQEDLAAWWTTHTVAKPEVGSISEFGFMGGQFVIKMKVDTLKAGSKVDWMVEQGAPDWAGTRVTWDLTPVDNGTKVLFGHHDFVSTDGSFANTSYNWAWYMTSLKNYIETGTGMPHTY